jgi:hypothetical protein
MQRKKISSSRLSLGMALLTSVASAQSGLTREDLVCPCLQPVNRFGLSYRMGFNVSARFKNLGGYTAASNPGLASGAAQERFYDDGYNRKDSSTNHNDTTWFWGYQNASQISGNSVTMTSSSAPANGSSERNEDPQQGIELTYNRELGHYEKWRWGIEAALGYMDVSIGNNSPFSGSRKDIADTFQNAGSTFPDAPYAGTYEGPGDLISSITQRQINIDVNGARVKGSRQFDADIYGLRFGPYLELPMSDRWSVSFSGGLALLSINSDYKFNETISLEDRPSQTKRGDGSHHDFVPGAYVGGNFLYSLRENVSLFAGAQFQAAGTYSHKESGKEVELDLGKTLFVNLGVGFSF